MKVLKQNLKKIPYPKAIQILDRYQLSPDFKKQILPDTTPIELIKQSYRKKQWQELITFLCHALTASEAICWGYKCLVNSGLVFNNEEEKALARVKLWLDQPSETHRRLAEVAASQTGLESPCGLLAQAVFWSGGNITPVNGPDCPAPAYLHGHAVAGAIYMTCLLANSDQPEPQLKQAIRLGLSIAYGHRTY
ncbi:hypothetical protein EOPP23_12205 [Endozoicomonas sp. OPT23]|uniref:DUF6931 family protein n=1 Tax=Endozoicomonas sp. OPT23 TaxID=2072845 RepID=UPI00129BF74E|nr:hypothetical protein [Endozoicomonas sp. OPT23]MRI33750.1 hypothetical protein [Endozoicomonas sp. OPT23]